MTSSIKPRVPLPHLSNGHEKKTLKKSHSIWYAGTDSAPTQKSKNQPIPNKLSPDRVHIISEQLQAVHTTLRIEHPKTNTQPEAFQSATLRSSVKKTPPVPLPRSDKTCLSSKEPSHSAATFMNSSVKKAPAVPLPRSDKTCLRSKEPSYIETPKNTPPLPPPQESKPKFHPVSVATLASPQKRVSFPTKIAKDRETSLPQILKTLPVKGILKKTLSFRNTEGNEPYNETNPSTKIHTLSVLNEKPDVEKELDLAMDELNEVLKDLGIDPVLNSSK